MTIKAKIEPQKEIDKRNDERILNFKAGSRPTC